MSEGFGTGIDWNHSEETGVKEAPGHESEYVGKRRRDE